MSGLSRLGRSIAIEQDALAERERDRARRHAELTMRLRTVKLPAKTRAARGAWPWLWASGGLVAVLLGGAWLWRSPGARSPLIATVSEGGQAAIGAFIESPPARPLSLDFSDGTRFAIAPRARLRLLSLSDNGADVSLEAGSTLVSVVPKPRARWKVSAGPFAVRVTGTRFELRWEPERDRLELDLQEGHVELSGCVFSQPYQLQAGQRLVASCRDRRFAVVDRGAPLPPSFEAAPTIADEAEPSAPEATRERATPARTPSTRRRDVLKEIRALASRGEHRAAFERASKAGFHELCTRADAESLMLLADAARYAGDRAREAEALRALRRRFAGSSRAATAAFALGRLEFDHHGAFDKATRWFRKYLGEQPAGPLAREARGRLLEARLESGDAAAAERLAREYLRLYPKGPHAALARSTLGRSPL